MTLNITPMRDRAGVLTGYVVAAYDATERKQAEEKLSEWQQFLQRLTDTSPSVIVVCDLEAQRSVFTNRAVASVLGYSDEEITVLGDKVAPTLMHPEERLRDSEATFRAMFNVSSVGKVEADPATGRFTRVNAAMCELAGYTEAELLACTFFDITHPDERDQGREKVRQLVAGVASGYDAEKRYMRKDGSGVWVRVTANVVRDNEGRPVRNTAVIQTIDATKRSEIVLRESEARYRMAIRACSFGTWETDLAS